ncbi:MAG: hypothetical protein IJW14_04000 [Oscillospiraceae bacterium]|nr:hypothetical protein [Oscillospiraceae bacterium]
METEKKPLNENIIAGIIMVVIAVLLLTCVGFDAIKGWLSRPFVWEEPDYIDIRLFGIQENTIRKELTLEFALINRSDNQISRGVFNVWINGVEVQWDTHSYEAYPYDVELITTTVYCKSPTIGNSIRGLYVDEQTYAKLAASRPEDVQIVYETVSLEDYNADKTLVKNDGTVKIIVILVAALALGLLGFVQAFPKWLRITLKVCSLPAVVLILAVVLVLGLAAASRGSTGSAEARETGRRDAERKYKEAANRKAGALARGNTAQAAREQAQMDKAMGDLLKAGGTSNSDAFRNAQQRYNRAVDLKRGAELTGNSADAARAKAQQDKALADMLKHK